MGSTAIPEWSHWKPGGAASWGTRHRNKSFRQADDANHYIFFEALVVLKKIRFDAFSTVLLVVNVLSSSWSSHLCVSAVPRTALMIMAVILIT